MTQCFIYFFNLLFPKQYLGIFLLSDVFIITQRIYFRIFSFSIASFSAQSANNLHFLANLNNVTLTQMYVIKQLAQVAYLNNLICCHLPQT